MPEYVAGNRLTLLKNGEQYFPALEAAIDAARSEVFLETYIFADDRIGAAIANALSRAAQRGVAAHLLLDGFGSKDFAQHFREQFAAARVEVLVFRPRVSPWPPWRQRSRLRRMHRKLASIDGTTAFVGGINIIDDYDVVERPSQTPPPRFDYAVRIEGPLAVRARDEAWALWTRVALAAQAGHLARRAPAAAPAGAAMPENQRAALVVRDNLHHRRDIESAYLERIATARSSIIIACSYFFPGRRFRRALRAAARRGVHVTLLLQGRIEYALVHYASLALYGTLLGGGVRIYEYHRSYLHAKVAVFDDNAACVGSSNIDPLSLLLAREANVFVEDPKFAAELRLSLRQAMREGAKRLPLRAWRRMPLPMRLATWLGYRAARLLMLVYGYGRER